MKYLVKTLFVAVMALSVSFTYAQTEKTKTTVKKESKTKDGVTTTKKSVKKSKNGKTTTDKKSMTKTPATK